LARDPKRVSELFLKLNSNEKLEFVIGELLTYNYNLENIDVIIHLACEHNPYKCEEDSGQVIDLNVGGTLRLIEAVKKFNVPKLIFMSSFGIYGKQEKIPISEIVTPQPNGAKFLISYTCETIIKNFLGSFTKFVIFRAVHMFGIGVMPSRIKNELTYLFAKKASVGGFLPIYGTGNQTLDLIHVNDVCTCFFNLLISPDSCWNEIYNIGSGKATSINHIADIYIKTSEEMNLKRPMKTYLNKENYIDKIGLASYWLDISKVRSKLNWNPSMSLEEGIKELIKANVH
jgi:nucleoside-diphosphate-sugar epimerase